MQPSKMPGNAEDIGTSLLGRCLGEEGYVNDYLLYPWVKVAMNPNQLL